MNLRRRAGMAGVRMLAVTGFWCVAAPARTAESAAPVFDRREDPVIVRGDQLGALRGRPIAAVRVCAVRNGRLEPIPFQVDRIAPDGTRVYETIRARPDAPWGENPAVAGHPTLGDRDEIVMLARDLGPRCFPSDPRPGACGEIAARDPVNGACAYAYVVETGEAAPRAPPDYIRYDTGRCVVESDELSHGRRDPRHPAVFNHLTIGRSPNLVNRFRTRLRVTALFGKLGMSRDETDVEMRVLAFTDGPVRVLMKQESRVAGLFWMQSDWIERGVVCYPTRIEMPARLRVPFRPGLLVSEIRAEAMLELTRAAEGAQVWHPALAAPVVLSNRVAATPAPVPAAAAQECTVRGAFGGLTAFFRDDPRLSEAGLRRTLVCRTDGPRADGGEDGAFASLEVRTAGIERIRRGTYEFLVVLSGRRDFGPRTAEEFARIDRNPLAVTAAPVAPGP